jgi:putative oxidoreductase
MQKLFQMFGGQPFTGYQTSFSRMGDFWGGSFWVYYIGGLEFIGGLMVAVGFFTRFAACQLMLFMAMATFVANAPRGWFWTSGGSEAAASWMIVLAFICVYGSGKFSVDNALGKEI